MKKIKIQPIKQEDSAYNYPKQQIHETWQAIIPAAKVSPQVIEILRTTKVPELIIPSHTTISDAAKIYFDQYLRLFHKNRQLNTELIQTFEQRNQLAQKYNQLKREENDCEQTIRRKRRFANQIKRDFACPSLNCHKSYGSQGSLTQHVKLKHQAFYKSGEYEILLQKMLDEMTKHHRIKRQQQNRKPSIKVKKQENNMKMNKKQQQKNQ